MKVLSFRIADGLFGMDITHVKEINRNVEYTTVPGAADIIVGLFNMRGQVVTLFDLGSILGYTLTKKKGKGTCIILKSEQGNQNHTGFLIDDANEVLDIDDDICEKPPANIDQSESKYIIKVARLQSELLQIVDPRLIFEM